jgi:O-antigen ligase
VTAAVSWLLVLSTIAFGAVYSWASVPVLVAAACMGATGLTGRQPPDIRRLTIALGVVAVTIATQLLPLPRSLLARISPNALDLLARYDLTFATNAGPHALSIAPIDTLPALLGVTALGIYVLGLSQRFSAADTRAIAYRLIWFAVPLALFGIYSREHNNGLVYGFWRPAERDYSNGFGPFINRNHFAGWMVMATSVALGVLCDRVEAAVRHRRPTGWKNATLWLSNEAATQVPLVVIAVLTMSLSLVWTLSRSGIISWMCALALFAGLVVRRRRLGRGPRTAIITMLIAVVVVAASYRGPAHLVRWFADTKDLQSRLGVWHDAWRVVHDFPLTGVGINAYPYAMLFYQRHSTELWMTRAHNDYLQTLAEGGLLVTVPAAVTMLLIVVMIGRRLAAARDEEGYWIRAGAAAGLVAIAIQETVEFSLRIPANALLCATLAAIALTPAHRRAIPLKH